MLSLRKLMDQKKEPKAELKSDSSIRYLKPVVLGIAEHAVDSDPEDLAQFRKTVGDAAARLEDSSSPEQILLQVGAVIHALEEYNRRASRASTSYRNEFRGILSALTETIASVSASSRTSVEQLQSIEKNLAGASDAVEIKLLRNRLTGCLTLIRNESARVRLESQQLVKSLKAAVMKASTQTLPFVAGTCPDPATGLAGAGAAEQLIARLLADGKAVLAAMLLVDQVAGLNTRFGRAAGDEALDSTAQYLATELTEFGALLRWNGPAFVLVAEEAGVDFAAFERRMNKVGGSRFERHAQIDQRSIHFNITFSWTIHRLQPSDSLEEAIRKMDAFVSPNAA